MYSVLTVWSEASCNLCPLRELGICSGVILVKYHIQGYSSITWHKLKPFTYCMWSSEWWHHKTNDEFMMKMNALANHIKGFTLIGDNMARRGDNKGVSRVSPVAGHWRCQFAMCCEHTSLLVSKEWLTELLTSHRKHISSHCSIYKNRCSLHELMKCPSARIHFLSLQARID